MSKSRNFSIYLLKDGYDARNALREGHELNGPERHIEHLPRGASLYIADKPPNEPWWKSYWGINADLKQSLKGAIIFLPMDERCVALTFGHTYHYLKNESYEYDFGLITTLNAIDPERIRSTDVLQPEDAKRERIQSPVGSDLTFFDIQHDESVVKKMTGVVRSELKQYFRNVTGATNVRISSKVGPSEIVGVCSKLLGLYEDDAYKTTFPDMQNITPIKDPTTVQKLDDLLLNAFQDESKELVLTVPDILDHETEVQFAYSGASHGRQRIYDDVFISHYREFLNDRDITEVDVPQLKRHRLNIQNENGHTRRSHSVYQCLLFDLEHEGNHYHLCDSNWYLIDDDFVNSLKQALDPHFVEHNVLRECDQKREDAFCKFVANDNADYECLDKTNISPRGQTMVEPCDLLTVENGVVNLIHIKISTRSRSLSHLFNQGLNSVEVLRLETKSKVKFKNLVDQDCDSLVDQSNFCVIYGIITAKDKSSKSGALPIFSRISLRRAVRSLDLMAIESRVVLIKDLVDRKG